MVKLMGPGGSLEMAIAALEQGADSVFVGPRGWSRRPKSDELNDQELGELLDYGTRQEKDIRVAINVMPSPREIPAFLGKVEQVAARGAQGVMICDPGCIALVHRHFPGLEIHVSVTAGLFNAEDINLYRELGASIVVVPYRWGSAEISALRQHSDIALEAFLFQPPRRSWICPGRCYASSYFHLHHKRDEQNKDHFIGSASRGGSCHRICRSAWEMTRAESRPHASLPYLKDSPELLLWELPAYLQQGVTRLKIPGRERSVELVCSIVAFYRQVLDACLTGETDLSRFQPAWQQLQSRWEREKRRRDTRQITLARAG